MSAALKDGPSCLERTPNAGYILELGHRGRGTREGRLNAVRRHDVGHEAAPDLGGTSLPAAQQVIATTPAGRPQAAA
jgi:hypothetical protein